MAARARTARLLAILTLPLVAATGGPDASNAVFTDSDEVDGPPHGTLDLSGGTSLSLSDDGSEEVSLPFSFDWYGTEYDTVTVSNNGTLFFSDEQDTPVTSCPGGSGTWSGIAAFADDLDEGTVRYATFGRYPHRIFAVEWVVPHASVGGEGTVQAWLLEGGGRRQESVVVLDDITFGSSSVDGGAGAIIGVQPGDGSSGLAWSCSGGLSDGSSAWFGLLGARPASTQRTDSTLEAAWYGVDTAGYLGLAIAAGDANDDGLSDLLLGQPQDDLAYLVYGVTSAVGDSIDVAAAVTLSYGESDSPDLADALLITDLDADGVDDLLLGAPLDDASATNAGAIYGVAGGTIASALSLPDDADLLLGGPTSVGDARAGSAFAAADFDGDGYTDLVVGAPYADTSDTQSGAAYLWYGSLTSLDAEVDDLDSAAVLQGAGKTDWAGASVAVADVDADGAPEILVGAPNVDDGSATNVGAVYFMVGAVSAGSVLDLDTDSDVVILGDSTGDKAGSAVGLVTWTETARQTCSLGHPTRTRAPATPARRTRSTTRRRLPRAATSPATQTLWPTRRPRTPTSARRCSPETWTATGSESSWCRGRTRRPGPAAPAACASLMPPAARRSRPRVPRACWSARPLPGSSARRSRSPRT